MKKIVFTAILLLFMVSTIIAQSYKIEVNIKNVTDSMLLMAVYSGNEKYVRDTAFIDKKGKAIFTKNKALDAGIYIIAMGGNQLFDFIVSDENQDFAIFTEKDNYIDNLKFENSIENEEFAKFNRYMFEKQQREDELRSMVIKNPGDAKVVEKAELESNLLNKEYHAYVEKIGQEFPNSLLRLLAKTLDKPEIPDFDIDKANPKYDSIYTMKYYLYSKQHFFDNYDFTDKRMINTPVFLPTVNYYFDNVLVQVPDSIIPMLDVMLKKAEPNPTMLRFIAGNLFNKYMSSDIMGMESIVVHLVDNYYLKGKLGEHDAQWLAQAKEFADKNRNTLIGKQASDLKMQNIAGQYESIYSHESSYILLYFYEPNCGHCKTETPKVYNVYKKYKDKGFEVFAVYTQHDKNEWTEYIKQNELFDWVNVWDPNNDNNFRFKYDIYNTPTLILIDKDKKIIGRRINAESLNKMLDILLNKRKN